MVHTCNMSSGQTNKDKRLLAYEDLRRLELLSFPVAEPRLGLVAYVRRLPDDKTGKLSPRVFLTDREGRFDLPVSVCAGDETMHPLFSPDGARLAFLGSASGCQQVWMLDLAEAFGLASAGELTADTVAARAQAPSGFSLQYRQVSSLRHGVSGYAWAPDGRHLAVAAPLWPGEAASPQMTKEDLADFAWQKKHLPTYVTSLMYKLDESYGLRDGSFHAIGIQRLPEAAAGEPAAPKMITEGPISFTDPVFSADGRVLYFSGMPYGHKDAIKSELYACPDWQGKAPAYRQITKPGDYEGSEVLCRPGDEKLYYSHMGAFDGDMVFSSMLYALTPAEGAYPSERVFPTDLPCDGIAPLHVGITENGEHRPAYQASADGRRIFFRSAADGRAGLYAFDPEGGAVEAVTEGDFSITDFAVLSNDELVVLLTTETMPPELYRYTISEKKATRLLAHNRWLEEVKLSAPRRLALETDDEKMPVQGFVCPPCELAQGSKVPAFHYIHGGPQAYYAVGFDFEVQMLAARGIAVMYCNPRGSAGYGSDFVLEAFSYDGTAYRDLMDFTDLALRCCPFIDEKRIAVGGGSHGGWMTNYIMGHTDRFVAAVDQRTWSNPSTSYGTGDLGFYSQSTQGADSFMEYMENRARKSTIRDVDRFTTPCLILHGQKDYRCSLEQGEQVFSAMKVRVPQVPVKMVVFPGENHGVSRTGRIHWQIAHLREMTEWVLHYTSPEQVAATEERRAKKA